MTTAPVPASPSKLPPFSPAAIVKSSESTMSYKLPVSVFHCVKTSNENVEFQYQTKVKADRISTIQFQDNNKTLKMQLIGYDIDVKHFATTILNHHEIDSASIESKSLEDHDIVDLTFNGINEKVLNLICFIFKNNCVCHQDDLNAVAEIVNSICQTLKIESRTISVKEVKDVAVAPPPASPAPAVSPSEAKQETSAPASNPPDSSTPGAPTAATSEPNVTEADKAQTEPAKQEPNPVTQQAEQKKEEPAVDAKQPPSGQTLPPPAPSAAPAPKQEPAKPSQATQQPPRSAPPPPVLDPEVQRALSRANDEAASTQKPPEPAQQSVLKKKGFFASVFSSIGKCPPFSWIYSFCDWIMSCFR